MCVKELRCLSCWSFLSRTPVVQYSRRVHSPDWFSILIWYPHSDDWNIISTWNMIIKASGSASHQPALLFVWELIIKFQITGHKAFTRLRKNVFSPSTPVHPRSQAPGWLCRLGSWQISCGAGSPRCCRAVPLYPQSTTPPGGTEESEYSFRCPSLQPPRPQGGAAEPPGHDTGVGRQEAALALPWRRDTRWMTWIYLK